jgi:predicted permease
MAELFTNTFLSVSGGILKIFIIAFLAGILVWKKIIREEHIDALSKITVYVFLPCLIFSVIFSGFKPEELPIWWTIPLGVIFFTVAGTGISALFFLRKLKSARSILPLGSMQNAAYLALPIGEFIYHDQFNQFAVYCFLVVLGISPVLWTLGNILVTNKSWSELRIKDMINPPLIANILAILLVLTHTKPFVPVLIADTFDFMGKAAVPAATLVLGSTLATVFKSLPSWGESLKILFVKFVVMPASVILLIHLTGLREHYSLLSEALVIQAATAPATSFIIQVRTYGGDLQRVGGHIFISYFVTLIAIPLWLSVIRLF